MKQLVQRLESGELAVVEVPAPQLRAGGVLVRVAASVISVGTERTKVEFGRKSLLGKARARPDQVRKVLEVARREGAAAAYRKARSRLAALSPMGYSLAGVVEAVGEGVTGIRTGDRVACAGAGYANHAEVVFVPARLAARVPDGVESRDAAFATVGAIALHGVRQSELRLGETAVVIGLGLLGQLAVQILRAAGVQVIGVDVDAGRVELAARSGAIGIPRGDDVVARVSALTGGLGADAVLITAATASDDPVRLATAVARDRGRIVVVGAVPVHPDRDALYEKELELRLSRSYGPGRYDPAYEEKGHDYPAAYVRWTEQRNLEAFLALLADGSVRLDALVTESFPFERAGEAYALLTGERARAVLGVVLEYPAGRPEPARIVLGPPPRSGSRRQHVRVGMIGAGSFASGTLAPLLRKLGAELRGIVSAGGLSARSSGERFGFAYAANDPAEVILDPDTDAVVIATRHADHARLTAQALRAGKAVFVEKPLALDEPGLDDVVAAAVTGAGPLLVGFNRRFAPATHFLLERLRRTGGARVVHIRVNAGAVPAGSWVHDPADGGGRLLGEGCHFIDLALRLAGSAAVQVAAVGVGSVDADARLGDNVQITISCANGSLATVLYTGKGDPRAGKERVEVFAGGAAGIIDDFRRAEFWGGSGRERWRGSQDKGHAAELRAFLDAVRSGGPWPVALEELDASSRTTLAAARALATGMSVGVGR